MGVKLGNKHSEFNYTNKLGSHSSYLSRNFKHNSDCIVGATHCRNNCDDTYHYRGNSYSETDR